MLDATDCQLLALLARDSRTPLKTLAAEVGMSAPSVAERVRRLEERGIIKAFTIEVDPAQLGYAFQAIVRVRPLPGNVHIVQKLLSELEECTECDKVTGDDCFIARIFVTSIGELDKILDQIGDRAETNTSIVKVQVVPRRVPPLPSHKR